MKIVTIIQFVSILLMSFSFISCSGKSGRRIDFSATAASVKVPGVATQIKIEDAAGGTGTEVTTLTLLNGASVTLFAVARDAFGDFVADITVNWSTSTIDGYFSNLTGTTTVFTPTGGNESITINAVHSSLGTDMTDLIDSVYEAETLSGLTLWLRADSLLGKVADTDNVISWTDVNGSGRNVLALGGTQAPNFVDNVINGKPVLRFTAANSDGYASSFPISDIITSSEFTYFVVFNTSAISTDDAITSNNNALFIDNSGYFGATLRSGAPLVQSYNFDGTTSAEATKNIALSTTYLLTSYHESGNLFAQLNGDAAVTRPSDDTDNLGGQLTIGGGFAPAGFYEGDIAEILIYNESLSATDRQTVQDYLCTKYNLTCP